MISRRLTSFLLDALAVGSWALVGWLALGAEAAACGLAAAWLGMHGARAPVVGQRLYVLWGGERHAVEVASVGLAVSAYVLAGGWIRPDPEASMTGATVMRVVDGDTVVLADGTRVRLHGIDAPERDQTFGKDATECLSQLLGDGGVAVEPIERDVYGRMVARLWRGRIDIGRQMVRIGCAWSYGSAYVREQGTARAARAGLWSTPRPIPPWRWRRMH